MNFVRAFALLVLAAIAMAQSPATCKLDSQCTKNQYCNTEGSSECETLLKLGDRCIKDSWCASKNCLDTAKCSADPKPLSPVIIIAIAAGGVALLFVIVVVVFCIIKKKRANKSADPAI